MTIVKMKDLQKEIKGEKKQNYVGLKPDDFVISHKKLIETPITPVEYIVDPIIPINSYVLLHAASGIGKTYFALNIAYITAQGGNFLKFKCSEPQKVLYVDAEMGEQAIRRRIDSFKKIHGELDFDNLHYLSCNKFANSMLPSLDTHEGRDFYTKILIDGNYKGIFLDNLFTLTSSTDFNKTSDWAPIQQWIIDLRNKNIFVFLIHHSGSDATKQYGTVARKTIADTVISLQKIDDEINHGKIKVFYEKVRELPKEGLSFEAKNNFDGSWSFRDLELSFDEKVYDLLKRGDKVTQIAMDLKEHRSKIYRAIDRLKGKGFTDF